MRKKFLIVLIVLLTAGCTANYNLNIKDDNFYESVTISALNSNEDEINLLNTKNNYIKSSMSSDLIYNKTITKLDTKTKYNFSHVYSLEDFSESLSDKCFSKAKLDFTDRYYTLFLKDFNCFGDHDAFASNYKVSIKTDYKVLNTNSEYTKNNTYYWTFNKKNYKNKSIIFQYSKKEIKENKNISPLIISILISSVIGAFIYISDKYLKHRKVV